MSTDGAAARVRNREGDLFFEHIAPGPLRRMGEVENDVELAETAKERSATVAQSPRRRVETSGELVRVVPGQTRRAHTASVPVVERARIAVERLDTLHR